jgi:Major Facilitator Superfamily
LTSADASAGQDADPAPLLGHALAGAAAGGPLAEPVSRVSPGWMAAVAVANLGLLMAYFGPLGVLLPDQVQAVAGAHRIIDFSWVSGLGAVVAIVVNPLAGALSDRTISRFGRRRPWILGGSLVTAAALCLVGRLHTVPEIAAGWCLAQVGVNTMQAGLAAAVPDWVPVSQRGTVSGWIGIAQTISVVAAAALVTDIAGYSGYLVLAAGVIALALPFVFCTADPPLPRADRPDFSWRMVTGSCWSPRSWTRDFRWAWLTRFLMVLGNAMAVVYLLYFLRRIDFSALHPGYTAEQGLVILLSLYAVAVIGTTVIAGRPHHPSAPVSGRAGQEPGGDQYRQLRGPGGGARDSRPHGDLPGWFHHPLRMRGGSRSAWFSERVPYPLRTVSLATGRPWGCQAGRTRWI